MNAPDYITRTEHEEFAKRIDDENRRQNHRIEIVEQSVSKFTELTVSVERIAVSLKTMADELVKQGERLESLEKKDGQMWQTVVKYAATAGVGAVIWALVQAAGVF